MLRTRDQPLPQSHIALIFQFVGLSRKKKQTSDQESPIHFLLPTLLSSSSINGEGESHRSTQRIAKIRPTAPSINSRDLDLPLVLHRHLEVLTSRLTIQQQDKRSPPFKQVTKMPSIPPSQRPKKSSKRAGDGECAQRAATSCLRPRMKLSLMLSLDSFCQQNPLAIPFTDARNT